MTNCFGIILAGGRSRRMGGVEKSLLEIGGAPILAHVIRRLERQCAGLVLNANGDPRRFFAFGLPIAPDSVEGFTGPLAGVLAGLDYIAKTRTDVFLAVSVPADTPFVPPDLVERLEQARSAAGAEIAVASSGGRAHHAVALWPVSLRKTLRHALVEGDIRKVSAFIERHRNIVVEWPVTPFDPFFNVNRPGDLAEAEGILATHLAD
jgi:molybdopterin-guanine dinucleotide biosynthesis protein A